MYILIVEDDYLQADLIEEAIEKDPDLAMAKIRRISTENQFRSNFEDIACSPPDVIIMDIMLRWADPAPNMTLPPSDIDQQGHYRAGLRNERLLAQDARTRQVPVILYTILEDIDLEVELEDQRLHYLPKDSKLEPLVQKLRSILRNRYTQRKT